MSSPQDEPLLDLLDNRLAHDGVPEETAALVRAACSGEAQLVAALAGQDSPAPSRPRTTPASAAPLYLESVTAAGFRGVGPSASVRLQPGPGLTLIVGRNGSGKSSFAEAAELCLTGSSPRWAEQSVFREGWRNLHQGAGCQVQVTLRADGSAAPVRITRSWADDAAAPDQAAISVTANGQRYDDLGALDWATALDTYRPFLTAGDFGRLISARPSTLFDALAPILGLDQLASAYKVLTQARKDVSDRLRELRSDAATLRGMLTAVDDERARAAAAVLARKQPDLDELDAILARTDDAGSDPVAAACRRLARASMPDPALMAAAADRLDTAATGLRAAETTDSRAARQVADVLQAALALHADAGDGPCPVCATGQLDQAWRARAIESLDGLRAQADQISTASRRLADARREVTSLAASVAGWPDVADAVDAAPALGEASAELSRRLGSWQEIAAGVTGADPATLGAVLRAEAGQGHALELSDQLREVYPALHQEFTAARQAAADWLQRRHDAWREPAAALQAWLGRARRAAGDDLLLARTGAARDWLKTATEEIRAARLAPFAQRSQQIWELLRQESNVELSGMRLDGSSTRRRVMFPATVDGTATQAMAVMSHGEMQALGLAVFLPRASADDSPFRFLLIDDPVHSMDPSKVDGLARVLESLAATRQVIVLTHDNRLPEAVRRLEVAATIWEVTRRQGSVVELRKNLDPVARYIDDARSLALTPDIPEAVRLPVIAGFCRSAIEAACQERIRRERLAAGARHADVDELIASASTLSALMALALSGSAGGRDQIMTRLNRQFGHWAGDVYKECQKPLHGNQVALKAMIRNAERLAGALR
ncbi:MAG TPA: AAA family ATPase [Streptosporangiaceae bacterium]